MTYFYNLSVDAVTKNKSWLLTKFFSILTFLFWAMFESHLIPFDWKFNATHGSTNSDPK